jgi:LAO/AO transport system kinase
MTTDSRTLDPADLARRVAAGERAALARAITLVESKRADHRAAATALIEAVLPRTGAALRLGITGVPGAGKSTLIDALGVRLTGRGHHVAVLAVDPSSTRTGGSILGDKTRMAQLAVDPNAFIRPSPTSGTLGGVAAKTRESLLLVEAAGYDVVIVETVGVGQSETAVAGMVDFFLVLMAPATGDDLQGIKKGILELADMIVVNKADGDMRERAQRAAGDYRAALHILTPPSAAWTPPVVTVSGLTGDGLDEMWAQVLAHRAKMTATGAHAARRAAQQVAWMWDSFEAQVLESARTGLRDHLPALEAAVRGGRISPTAAVADMLAHLKL